MEGLPQFTWSQEILQGFVTGDYGDINISVVHPDAIDVQNPYDELQYEALPTALNAKGFISLCNRLIY